MNIGYIQGWRKSHATNWWHIKKIKLTTRKTYYNLILDIYTIVEFAGVVMLPRSK